MGSSNPEDQHGAIRYKRARALRACQTCNKRKVRCDVTTKNYPLEKCTNCQEFNSECVLVHRRKKRTKAQIEADRLAEEQQLRELGIKPEQASPPHTPASQQRKRKSEGTPDHEKYSPPVDPDGVQVDTESLFNKEVDRDRITAFSSAMTSDFGLKIAMLEYFKMKGKMLVKDLVSKQSSYFMKCTGCFILPNEKKCWKYIDAYFDFFQALYPCLSKSHFYQEFRDLKHPPSILMLTSILYVGSRVFTQTDEEKEETLLLHERARIILNSDIETNPIYFVLSTFLIGTNPLSRPTLRTSEDSLSSAIKLAINFGMHKDVESFDFLKPHEKKNMKRLFWMLVGQDRGYAFAFCKNYNYDLSNCTVKELDREDFEDVGISDVEGTFTLYKSAIGLQQIMEKVTIIQKTANAAAFNKSPVLMYHKQIDFAMNKLYKDIWALQNATGDSLGCFICKLFFHSLNMFIQRVKIFRIHTIIHNCTTKEANEAGYSNYLDNENLDVKSCWISLAESAIGTCDMITTLLAKYKSVLSSSQGTLYLIYLAPVSLIPFLFFEDEKISSAAKASLERVVPQLEQLIKDAMSWHMVDVAWFILKKIVPDKNLLIHYARGSIGGPELEKVIADACRFKNLGIIAKKNMPPFNSPIFNKPDLPDYLFPSNSDDGPPTEHKSPFKEPTVPHPNSDPVSPHDTPYNIPILLDLNNPKTSPATPKSNQELDYSLAEPISFPMTSELLAAQLGDTKAFESYVDNIFSDQSSSLAVPSTSSSLYDEFSSYITFIPPTAVSASEHPPVSNIASKVLPNNRQVNFDNYGKSSSMPLLMVHHDSARSREHSHSSPVETSTFPSLSSNGRKSSSLPVLPTLLKPLKHHHIPVRQQQQGIPSSSSSSVRSSLASVPSLAKRQNDTHGDP